jgi:hypothetical protein
MILPARTLPSVIVAIWPWRMACQSKTRSGRLMSMIL